MLTPAAQTPASEAKQLLTEGFDPIHFETHLKDHDEWADLIEIVHSANELARLARALVARDSS